MVIPDPVILEDEGAEPIQVCVSGELIEIGHLGFSESEARKIYEFIKTWLEIEDHE